MLLTSIPKCAPGSPPPALDLSFHPDLVLLGQRGRRLFCYADPPALAARRVPLTRRPASRDQPLPRRAQPQTQTLRLDRRPRPHHRKGQPWIPSVGVVRPLVGRLISPRKLSKQPGPS